MVPEVPRRILITRTGSSGIRSTPKGSEATSPIVSSDGASKSGSLITSAQAIRKSCQRVLITWLSDRVEFDQLRRRSAVLLIEKNFKKSFPTRPETIAREKAVGIDTIEIWFADEARIGQKNKITRRWALLTGPADLPEDSKPTTPTPSRIIGCS